MSETLAELERLRTELDDKQRTVAQLTQSAQEVETNLRNELNTVIIIQNRSQHKYKLDVRCLNKT